jgi:hypothetical protein
MKVGDLIKYETVPYEFSEVETYIGVIVELSRTGHKTLSARVFFTDGDFADDLWIDTAKLNVIDVD